MTGNLQVPLGGHLTLDSVYRLPFGGRAGSRNIYEDIVKSMNNATTKDVYRSLGENVGLEADKMASLEYYMDGQGKPFKDPPPLEGKKAVPIRIKSMCKFIPTKDHGMKLWIRLFKKRLFRQLVVWTTLL
jgi:hypothetical protein